MSHKPIVIENLAFELAQKVCFSQFSTRVLPGDKIAIIGRNASGKSTLLKMLLGELEPSAGRIKGVDCLSVGYVPQTVLEYDNMSGGERFNRAFSEALAQNPDVLILDEPTNHLDQKTRYSLMRMLNAFPGTLIVATHDTNFINQCANILWHIDNGKISIFSGNYEDYKRERHIARDARERQLDILKKEKKKLKIAKIKELKKSAKQSKSKPKDNERLSFNGKASKGQATSDARVSAIRKELDAVQHSISNNRLPEILIPKFILTSDAVSLTRNILNISQGSCGYETHKPIVSRISLSMSGDDKISFSGDNGSGKTTLLRAILGDPSIYKEGNWTVPNRKDIGYVDQHYANLDSGKTVEDIIHDQNPSLTHAEIRKHLNDYLFRKNEEVFEKVKNLSGGEKARLSLAQIAARPPELLILDEITNNVDIETKEYIATVLSEYPGAFIIISHEPDFLDSLSLTGKYYIEKGVFCHKNQRDQIVFQHKLRYNSEKEL